MRSGIYIEGDTLYVVNLHFVETPAEIDSGDLNLIVSGNMADRHRGATIKGKQMAVTSNVFGRDLATVKKPSLWKRIRRWIWVNA